MKKKDKYTIISNAFVNRFIRQVYEECYQTNTNNPYIFQKYRMPKQT